MGKNEHPREPSRRARIGRSRFDAFDGGDSVDAAIEGLVNHRLAIIRHD